ncbi:MAG: SCO family protein [Pseudomonadota bacterium]|nr:SCO family protein [Pseudomonadota bacterium]
MIRALALLPVLLSVALGGRAAEVDSLKAGVFSPPRPAPDFTLAGSDGAPLTLSRYRGKVVALAFGFSHCADVCPVTLATLAQARKALGPQGRDLQVVYVTVDPERDDAARMKSWLAAFDPGFVGGTGSKQALAAVDQSYGVAVSKIAASGGASFGHSSSVYLIDREGRLRAMMPYGHVAEDYVHDVRLLMQK